MSHEAPNLIHEQEVAARVADVQEMAHRAGAMAAAMGIELKTPDGGMVSDPAVAADRAQAEWQVNRNTERTSAGVAREAQVGVRDVLRSRMERAGVSFDEEGMVKPSEYGPAADATVRDVLRGTEGMLMSGLRPGQDSNPGAQAYRLTGPSGGERVSFDTEDPAGNWTADTVRGFLGAKPLEESRLVGRQAIPGEDGKVAETYDRDTDLPGIVLQETRVYASTSHDGSGQHLLGSEMTLVRAEEPPVQQETHDQLAA